MVKAIFKTLRDSYRLIRYTINKELWDMYSKRAMSYDAHLMLNHRADRYRYIRAINKINSGEVKVTFYSEVLQREITLISGDYWESD